MTANKIAAIALATLLAACSDNDADGARAGGKADATAETCFDVVSEFYVNCVEYYGEHYCVNETEDLAGEAAECCSIYGGEVDPFGACDAFEPQTSGPSLAECTDTMTQFDRCVDDVGFDYCVENDEDLPYEAAECCALYDGQVNTPTNFCDSF